jgi:Uma2 family endonuclease
VLSPTSGRTDRIFKVREYAAVSSVRRYVILESASVGLQVLERSNDDQPWTATALTGDDILRMPEIGIEVPVGEFYEDVDFGGDATAELPA